MKSLRMAYLFWLPSLFGFAGLHRFYLGKIGSGILYFLTWGLFGIGTIYDAITMPDQVREARLRERYREALDFELDHPYVPPLPGQGYAAGKDMAPAPKKESIEHVILRVAKKNSGIATPSEVALEGDVSTDQAKEYLDKLVSKGFAEIRVKKSGLMVYTFPDFMDEHRDTGFVEM